MNLLTMIDTGLVHTFPLWRTPFLVDLAIGISELGRSYIILGLAAIAILIFLLRRKFALTGGLLVSVLGTTAAVYIVKELVARPRPDAWLASYVEQSFSFPSGHAALSVAFYGFIAWVMAHQWPHRSRSIFIAAAILVALIIFTRLYLGLHYLTDVAGGAAIGAIFLMLGIAAAKKLRDSFLKVSS